MAKNTPLYSQRLGQRTRVKVERGDGWLYGTVAKAIRLKRHNLRPVTLFIIHWDDGSVERWVNGSVRMGSLRKISNTEGNGEGGGEGVGEEKEEKT